MKRHPARPGGPVTGNPRHTPGRYGEVAEQRRWQLCRRRHNNHLLRVAVRIMYHYEVGNPEVICAALLHDAVEDLGETWPQAAGTVRLPRLRRVSARRWLISSTRSLTLSIRPVPTDTSSTGRTLRRHWKATRGPGS